MNNHIMDEGLVTELDTHNIAYHIIVNDYYILLQPYYVDTINRNIVRIIITNINNSSDIKYTSRYWWCEMRSAIKLLWVALEHTPIDNLYSKLRHDIKLFWLKNDPLNILLEEGDFIL